MPEILQKIIEFCEWFMQTELPEDTLIAIGEMASACGSALYWLADKYIQVFGA